MPRNQLPPRFVSGPPIGLGKKLDRQVTDLSGYAVIPGGYSGRPCPVGTVKTVWDANAGYYMCFNANNQLIGYS